MLFLTLGYIPASFLVTPKRGRPEVSSDTRLSVPTLMFSSTEVCAQTIY